MRRRARQSGAEFERLLLLAEPKRVIQKARKYFAKPYEIKEKIKESLDAITEEIKRLNIQMSRLKEEVGVLLLS